MQDYFDYRAQPHTAWITVNRNCNFRCQWCYSESTNPDHQHVMPLALAIQLLTIAVKAGAKQLRLIGGEPTLWPHFFNFNRYCRANDLQVSAVTNASRFGDDQFWVAYQKDPCASVGISIKGVSPLHFRQLVAAPTLENQTLLGIRRALTFHQDAGVGLVLSNLLSVEDVKEIAQAAHFLGAKAFSLSLCSATLDENQQVRGDYLPHLPEVVHQTMKVYPFLDELFAGKLVYELTMPLCFWPQHFIEMLIAKKQIMSLCSLQDRSGLVFDVDGSVLPCNSMINFPLGKCNQDFDDATAMLQHLNQPQLRNQFMELLRFPAAACNTCQHNRICRGGCVLNWALFEPSWCHAHTTNFRKKEVMI